jgi:hypothetical protein
MPDDEGFLPYFPKDSDLMAELYLPGCPEVGRFCVKAENVFNVYDVVFFIELHCFEFQIALPQLSCGPST